MALDSSGYYVEAAQPFLEARERYPEGSEMWARATAYAFHQLQLPACAEVAKPAWWNDEDLKALSKRVVRAAPNDCVSHLMRAGVLSGKSDAWEAGPRSAAELKEAATHYERSAELQPAPALKAERTRAAAVCRCQAAAM